MIVPFCLGPERGPEAEEEEEEEDGGGGQCGETRRGTETSALGLYAKVRTYYDRPSIRILTRPPQHPAMSQPAAPGSVGQRGRSTHRIPRPSGAFCYWVGSPLTKAIVDLQPPPPLPPLPPPA